MKCLFAGILFFMYCYIIFGQDIVYPHNEEPSHVSGGNSTVITERLPVLPEPGQCPDANMLLYPGDGMKDAWVCDCQEMFLYFPLNNSCHKAYRQGPCPLNHYVVLPENEAIPRCEANPCLEDGKVPYNGRCYYFQGIDSPCEEDKVLDVNETTFQLDCVLKEVNTLSIIVAPRRKCPRGTRRNMLGICKKVDEE